MAASELGSTAAQSPPLTTTTTTTTPTIVDIPDPFIASLKASEVPHIDSSSPYWHDFTRHFNIRLPVTTPRAVIYATSVKHVQDAVRCATENGLKVTPKSGGHSYAGYGLGGEDGHVVVQLDRMFGVTLRKEDDDDDGTATVLAGTRLGQVALELWVQGKRGISHGTCPGVGFAGHAIHGGFGFNSHTYGLAVDCITGVDIVLADGSLVHASDTENSDLFWALRGAGSSFGIAVSFEVKTFAVPEILTWCRVASRLGEDRDATVAGLRGFQTAVEAGLVPKKMNMRLGITSVGGVTLETMYHGTEEEARAALEPLVEPLMLDWSAERTKVGSGNWLAHLNAISDGAPLKQKVPYQSGDCMYASSLTTKHLPDKAIESFVDYWIQAKLESKRPWWWIQMDLHGDANSAIPTVTQEDTSYAHRDKLWLFQFADPTVDCPIPNPYTKSFAFLNGFMDTIKDHLAPGEWGRYINYVDTELSREEAQEQYYGLHLGRLRRIKAKYDPDEVFYYPQSVKPE